MSMYGFTATASKTCALYITMIHCLCGLKVEILLTRQCNAKMANVLQTLHFSSFLQTCYAKHRTPPQKNVNHTQGLSSIRGLTKIATQNPL